MKGDGMEQGKETNEGEHDKSRGTIASPGALTKSRPRREDHACETENGYLLTISA